MAYLNTLILDYPIIGLLAMEGLLNTPLPTMLIPPEGVGPVLGYETLQGTANCPKGHRMTLGSVPAGKVALSVPQNDTDFALLS